jgi:hypothetical protein
MSEITMTPIEFVMFKDISNFFFEYYIKMGVVFVTAPTDSLASLGY